MLSQLRLQIGFRKDRPEAVLGPPPAPPHRAYRKTGKTENSDPFRFGRVTQDRKTATRAVSLYALGNQEAHGAIR
jgi:hypothetical protein